jgi:hypothetical protein
MAESSLSALPSYAAATTEASLTNADAAYAYADFTISDLRNQILANAAMIKPIFNIEKSRTEYGLELTLIRGNSGQHAAMLLRNNISQPAKEDFYHGKIILRGRACDMPRQAFEDLLFKTEVILGDMMKGTKIEHALAREMNGWNPRQYD